MFKKNGDGSKNFAYSIMEKVVGTAILGVLVAMITVWSDVQRLNAFANEGSRFTENDFIEFKEETVEHQKEVKQELKDIKKDAKQNRETLIRIESLMRQQAGLPPFP